MDRAYLYQTFGHAYYYALSDLQGCLRLTEHRDVEVLLAAASCLLKTHDKNRYENSRVYLAIAERLAP
jgi:hypothetical protein